MAPERVGAEPAACSRHRTVQTYLRCSRCGTPICPRCLVHTAVGARCPSCGSERQVRPAVGFVRLMGATGAGLGIGMLAGMALAIIPFGGLAIIPLLLTGLLVGEAMSAAARRRGSWLLALLAFACTVIGPILGRGLLVILLSPGVDVAVRAAVAVEVALRSFGLLGIVLLLGAGVLASTRVQNR
ncbi:MAG: putative rane protein [Chloroflexi bacterium]|nr:putative rane protein [Chloroflexota bacterium]